MHACAHPQPPPSFTCQGPEPRASFTVADGRGVSCLAVYSKGFVAGLDGGRLALYERDEREAFRHTRTFTVNEHPQTVRCVFVCTRRRASHVRRQGHSRRCQACMWASAMGRA